MLQISRKLTFLWTLIFCLLLTSWNASAQTNNGKIEGVVTDQQGALVAGASVTATESQTQKTYTARTNAQGRYQLSGLPVGNYLVIVEAKGFAVMRRESIALAAQSQALTLDVRLEVATVEAGVTVAAAKPNTDGAYQELRQNENFGDYATVNNLTLQRDAATFTLRSGEIYFLTPVQGRIVGAVFIGDGTVSLTPPVEVEKKSLAVFTNAPKLEEQFSYLVLRFTDQTYEELKKTAGVQMNSNGPQAARARELYHDKASLLRKTLRYNIITRTLADLYAPPRPGYFLAFIGGKRFGKLVYQVDPMGIPDVSPEQVALISYGESDGGIWTAFHLAGEYQRGTATSNRDRRTFDLIRHQIDAGIKGEKLAATDKITLATLVPGTRVMPFDLFRSLRVSRVADEQGREVPFIQEDKDEDADFAVILPSAPETGKQFQLTVEYVGGEALSKEGAGNFILLPRSSWYPNNGGTQFGDRATFDMTVRYPKKYTLVGVGEAVEPEKTEGDLKVAHWSSGDLNLAVAGFNYGDFKKKEVLDPEAGYGLEVYYNTELPDEMKAIESRISGTLNTAGGAGVVMAEAQNATRIYNAFFGKLPYKRIAMTQQPAGFFGQAWPTLVFMPYIAFIDTTQRVQLFGVRGATNGFWREVAAHEVAHQWWGHIVGWTSYHDQWMSEGFAEFSTSLYILYVKRDLDKFLDFWEEQRKQITEESQITKGRKPYTVGPVTQGYRLNNAKTGNVAQFMIYPKGAYILHMLRMMMYDQKGGTRDQRFQAMMQDFIKTHYNQDVSTEDFKRIVEKHILPKMDIDKNGTMNWFFDQWVYGWEMPSYRFDYQIAKTPDGKATLTGKVTQSGVSDNFVMIVPIYLDMGKGWSYLGSVTIVGNASVDLPPLGLPQAPKQAAICALKDVLALKIENNKQ